MSKSVRCLFALLFAALFSPAPALADESIEAFAPMPADNETRIDYSYWNEALGYFVYRMGPSERRQPRSVAPELGTRIVYGHDSRLRLEGNRVGFSFLEQEQIDAISAYRKDLELVASQVNITALSRNEQLAYWLNLHNVAVIEQIAKAYPVREPSRIRLGANETPLDKTRFITVNGVQLSPHDIRTRIVFPNWKDPRVIYGFFRGEIGGPTILSEAFTAENLSVALTASAQEFVNSLRGTEKRGDTLHVSTIYEEAAPFFFPDFNRDVQAHLQRFSNEKVRSQLERTSYVEASIYERDISDLAGAEFDPEIDVISYNLDPKNWGFEFLDPPLDIPGVPRNVSRLVQEKQEKMQRMLVKGELQGIVTVLDMEAERGAEVE